MRPTDKIIVRIQIAAEKGRGVRLSADDVWELAQGVFSEDIAISEPDIPLEELHASIAAGRSALSAGRE